MNTYQLLTQTKRQRVSDGARVAMVNREEMIATPNPYQLILVLPQLGDFDSLEYAWWLKRDATRLQNITVWAIGIGNRESGQQFCAYTGFPPQHLWVDPEAEIHQQLSLYPGLSIKLPGFSASQNAWLNLLLMCAGIGSPGTLTEVFRGYRGDRQAPQLIGDDEIVQASPLPALKGSFFSLAGGKGFQRPFELATLRLRNMAESLGHWQTYVPKATHLTQRGATYLFDHQGTMIYEHCDRNILGFAKQMNDPLSFLDRESLNNMSPQKTPSEQTDQHPLHQ